MPKYLCIGGPRGGDTVEVPQYRAGDVVHLPVRRQLVLETVLPLEPAISSMDEQYKVVTYHVCHLCCGDEILDFLTPTGWSEMQALRLAFRGYEALAKHQKQEEREKS